MPAKRTLAEYERKRDFGKTPEPAPGPTQAQGKSLSYLIQKHDATRLHYDFRLELDGVLLSWAVTKGPSLNPADKRLAVRTEDHPLSYGSFEGTIPEGQYGGGTVMLWDKGSWEPTGDPHAGLEKGHLAFTLQGDRLKGGWDLVRMRGKEKRENWLLIKHRDESAETGGDLLERFEASVESGRSMEEIARGRSSGRKKPRKGTGLETLMQRYAEVQLATLTDKPPAGDEWVHEMKFDGYRLLGFVSGGEARLRTRNGQDWTAKFPPLKSALESLDVADAVIDMEAVVLNASGRSDFQALQAALGDGGKRESIIAYAFDLLDLNGEDLITKPLTARKTALEELLAKKQPALRYSEHIAGQGEEMFAKACEAGLEGIIAKSAGAAYTAGRQRSWMKIKCGRRQEFIILGYSGARSGDRALGALYLGYWKDKALRYAGKVGTGFSMKSARDLVERFATLSAKKPLLSREQTGGLPAAEWRDIHWLEPSLLCEVAFTEWTQDGRIRHPSFQGLREDKDAAEVKKETPVATTKKSSGLVLAGITITHPDRVISEIGKVTKGDLAQYYAGVAPLILPQIVRRPLSLLRCPSGIEGGCFYQRSTGKGLGADVHPWEFKHKGKKYKYLYIEDEKGLMELIQMGAIEIHPWGATIDAIDRPEKMVFDLDPAPDVPFEALKLAAEDLRQRLKKFKLESTLKCTGGKGLHVTVPLDGDCDWAGAREFAGNLAEAMVKAVPEAYVVTMSKAKRAGKIFIDYFRNDYTATSIADYSARARPGAAVAVPLEWKELKSLKAADEFHLEEVLQRAKSKKVPAPIRPQRLPQV